MRTPRRPTGGEGPLLALLDDLEQQAQGAALVERDLEVADRSRAEYAEVTLAARIHALTDRPVRLTLLGGLRVSGTVARTGPDWLLVADDRADDRVQERAQEWMVPHHAVAAVHGAGTRAVAEEALGVVRRLPLRAVLRRLIDRDCVWHLVDGGRLEGRLRRVGADFAEVRSPVPEEGYDVLPVSGLAAVQPRR